MGKFWDYFITAFAVLVGFAIVFVRAGASGGASGGTQTAQILNATGGSLGNLAVAIESGGMAVPSSHKKG